MSESDRYPDGVCVVTQPARREGGKTHAHQLLDILSEITAVCLLTANLDSNADVRSEYEVQEYARKGTGDWIGTAALRFAINQLRMSAAIARREEEAVLFFGATTYLLPILFSRLIGRTVIVLPRGDVPLSLRLQWEDQTLEPVAGVLAGLLNRLERIGFHAATAVVTYTPSMAEQLDLGSFEHKLHTNGARYVDVDEFTPTTPFEDRDETVGFIGRLDVEKGISELASVAGRLPDEVSFRFVGDGDYREALESELAAEIDAGQVELTGWVDHDEVPEELNRLKLLIMPSSPTEGLPTAILESLACGTPVYATPVAGVPDVVIDGETGFLMTESSSPSMASRIEAILGREDLAEISATGRELVKREYSFDGAVERYRGILESVQR